MRREHRREARKQGKIDDRLMGGSVAGLSTTHAIDVMRLPRAQAVLVLSVCPRTGYFVLLSCRRMVVSCPVPQLSVKEISSHQGADETSLRLGTC